MKLWLISQSENDGYDTYDSAVVAAETEEDAKLIHPQTHDTVWHTATDEWNDMSWTSKEDVQCKYLGEADASIKAGVICASFNAG